MPTYTPRTVERYLKNYLDIRYMLDGRGQQLPDTYAVKAPARSADNLPFGQTASGQAWPFMEPHRARSPVDGKRKARLLEDLHCVCLDIEDASKRVTDEDLELIYKYLILGTYTLDELVAERGVTSRGSMLRRIQRAVARYAYAMEHPHEQP